MRSISEVLSRSELGFAFTAPGLLIRRSSVRVTHAPPPTSAVENQALASDRGAFFFVYSPRVQTSKTGLCRKTAGTEESRPSESNPSHMVWNGIHQSTLRVLARRNSPARLQARLSHLRHEAAGPTVGSPGGIRDGRRVIHRPHGSGENHAARSIGALVAIDPCV